MLLKQNLETLKFIALSNLITREITFIFMQQFQYTYSFYFHHVIEQRTKTMLVDNKS